MSISERQIEYLQLLGYRYTDEEGAVLKNALTGVHVWKGSSFRDVLVWHNEALMTHQRTKIAREIMKGRINAINN